MFGFPLSFLLLQQGRFEEAREEILRWAPKGVPDASVDSIAVAFDAIQDESLRPRGIAILRYLESSTGHFQRNPPAAWYALLGDMDGALSVVRRMIDSQSLRLALLNWGRTWPLHDEPRFLSTLDEIGLPRPGN